ncbi:MAG TPA: LamG domain-containing protein [Bacillota bacterium]|nr:LamG domain-containing protein [Bacillota bacterium]
MKKFLLAGMILTLCFIVAFSGCNQKKPTRVANVTNGLIAWYPLNGNVEDAIGSNDGIIDPLFPISYTQDHLGNPNKAALFDGVDDLITIPLPGITLSPSNSFSVSLWIKTGTSVNQYPVYCGMFGFRQEDGTTFKFTIVGNNTSLDLTGNVTQATWTHIVGTYDDSTLGAIFYINGQSADTDTKLDNLGMTDINGLCLGTTWIGAIDDFRIYNRVLTGAEVNQLYKYRN